MQSDSILALYWGDWPRPEPNGTQCALLVQLSQENKILVVESPITILSPFLHRKKFWRWIKKPLQPDKILPNLSVFAPLLFLPYHPRLPIPTWIKKLINKLNNPLIYVQVKKFAPAKPILWLSMLHPVELINRFQHKLTCVLCYDEVSASPIFTKNQQILIKESEAKLLKKADIVFTTSKRLYNNKIKINPRTYFIPNAIETEFIDRVISKSSNPFKNIDKPHIGYIGKINVRIDLELIYNIARNEPCWQWVFIGPVEFSANKNLINILMKLKNAHFLGEKRYSEIADYLNHLDVLTIPFVINEFTKNMNPLKLYQYLASGKPIVSTNLPEVAEFNRIYPNLIYISSSDSEFTRMIDEAVKENDPKLKKQRIDIARDNTWDKRAQLISGIINENTPSL